MPAPAYLSQAYSQSFPLPLVRVGSNYKGTDTSKPLFLERVFAHIFGRPIGLPKSRFCGLSAGEPGKESLSKFICVASDRVQQPIAFFL